MAQTASATLGAWRAIPARGSVITPLTKVIQGAQEEYGEFVSRLLEAAERTLGQEESDNKLIKQLAYENANSACKAVLHDKIRDKDLNEMICLCRDVDTFTHLVIGLALQYTGPRTVLNVANLDILPGSALCGHPPPLLLSPSWALLLGPHSLAPSAHAAGGARLGQYLLVQNGYLWKSAVSPSGKRPEGPAPGPSTCLISSGHREQPQQISS